MDLVPAVLAVRDVGAGDANAITNCGAVIEEVNPAQAAGASLS
jgi:hypothetical protein